MEAVSPWSLLSRGEPLKIFKPIPREMIPKATPSKHHGNSIPHLPQGAGEMKTHQCLLSSLFTPFELGKPESEEG